MNRLREMDFVRVFLVVVVVLFVLGAGVPGGAFARVDIQNGHEGDPGDGNDIVGGGSGDPLDGSDSSHNNTAFLNTELDFDGVIVELKTLCDGTVILVFSFCEHSLEAMVLH